jgi:hypothetical protein
MSRNTVACCAALGLAGFTAWGVLRVVLLLTPELPALEPEAPAMPRLQAVRELGFPCLVRGRNVYHSAGYDKRALELCELLDEATAFYHEKLGINADFSLAVLTRRDWERIEPRAPYGLPSVSPAPCVVLLPATGDGVVVQDVLALRDRASEATLRKVHGSGFSFEQGAARLVDLIGLHEVGHVLTLAHGIHPPSRWANEFLATYFAYTFLHAAHPDWAALFIAMTHDLQCRDAPRPRHTSLEAFDLLYSGVGPTNYGWYQSAFAGRAREVHAVMGIAFLERVRSTFPPGSPADQPPRVVLERLEKIHRGFVAWGEGLQVAR